MRLLLAEDEKDLSDALVTVLKHNNYSVDAVYNGQDALDYLTEGDNYDGAILDIMMPKLDGISVLKQVRAQGNHLPILMLTAKSEIDDRVNGLDSGADDYLTKPFMTKELLARLRALLRRNIDTPDGTLKYGDISLDGKTYELYCKTTGQSVRLGDKEWRILEYLIANQNQILTREQLAVKIWGYDNDAEYNNVEVYMSFTRKKLAFIGAKTEIKAVRGVGYELRCDNV